MDTILNALLAPFSEERASKTSPAKTAVAYVTVGLITGLLLKD